MENNKKILTLCIIHQQFKILLGMKKRGFGRGRWNGFGGKVKEREDILTAAKRELQEEAGLIALDMEQLGILNFQWQGKPDILQVNVFKTSQFQGEPQETEEMKPCWFGIKEIPFEKMWQDDKYWLPLFLADKKFKGGFLFDDKDNILAKNLAEVKSL